jgi:hypothetical protein
LRFAAIGSLKDTNWVAIWDKKSATGIYKLQMASDMDRGATELLLVGVCVQVVGVIAVLAARRHSQLRKRRLAENEQAEWEEIYAARKQARRDASVHPRELLSQSVTEQAPSARRVVNVRLEHRLPISVTWQESVMAQWTEQEFLMNLRMSKQMFSLLLAKLEPRLSYGDRSGGGKRPTPPWALLAAVLCWLGGGRPQDFIEKFGMRMDCWKKRRWLVIRAINRTLSSSLAFPSTSQEMERISNSFSEWCHFTGSIGALDGLIVRVQCPDSRLTGVMRCDRHDCTGINLQAIVDADDQFRWISTAKYGSCADGRAFRETKLFDSLAGGKLTCGGEVPKGRYFILADNAYPIRSFLLHPFRGQHTPGTPEDSWNLNMSAARSAVERAFGQLVFQWQILKKGIVVRKIKRAHNIIRACVLLHNFRKQNSGAVDLDIELYSNDECRSAPVLLDHNVTLNSAAEGRQYARVMGDNHPGERTRESRQQAAVICADIGTNVRERLAQDLVRHGHVRCPLVNQI